MAAGHRGQRRTQEGGQGDACLQHFPGRDKRDGAAPVGSYEEVVQPELQRIVRERVNSLWEMGISGADLIIAAVGAGLRAFTRYARVEYSNGEEVPSEKFLAEVEGAVLDSMLEKLFGMSGGNVSAIDPTAGFTFSGDLCIR